MPSLADDAFFAGLSAGAVGTLIGFPLDTIKAHLQTSVSAKGAPSGMMASASAIYARGGLASFFSGVAAPMVSLMATSSINFSAYTAFRSSLGARTDSVAQGRPVDRHTLVAGAMVGPAIATINTPMELIKLQLQVNGTGVGGVYRSAMHATTAIIRSAGPQALYLGFGVNLAREMLFGASYFGIYELGTNVMSGAAGMPMAAAVPIAGGVAGVIGWTITLPLDVVKSILQVQDMTKPRALTPWGVADHVWRTHGMKGFFRGGVPSVARAFIVNVVRISVYETVMSTLKKARGACDTPEACTTLMCQAFGCRSCV